MGFSFSSFLGGASGAGSRGIEKRRDTLQREKETAEARQWQIATESRADSRNKKKARAVATREAEENLERLVFHYGEKNGAAMAGQGKGYIAEALKYADLYIAADVDPATQITISKLTGEGLPNPSATPALTGATPPALTTGNITFKPIPKKVDKEKNTWEERLVTHTDARVLISPTDREAITKWDEKYAILNKGYSDWKNAAIDDADGDKNEQLGVEQVRGDQMLNNVVIETYKSFQRVQTGVGDIAERVIYGNAVEELEIASVINGTKKRRFIENPVVDFVPDPYMKQKVLESIRAQEKSKEAYIRKVANVNTRGDNVIFHPFATQDEVKAKDAAGEYNIGDVVQYKNDNGVDVYGIVGTRGIF